MGVCGVGRDGDSLPLIDMDGAPLSRFPPVPPLPMPGGTSHELRSRMLMLCGPLETLPLTQGGEGKRLSPPMTEPLDLGILPANTTLPFSPPSSIAGPLRLLSNCSSFSVAFLTQLALHSPVSPMPNPLPLLSPSWLLRTALACELPTRKGRGGEGEGTCTYPLHPGRS